MMSAWQNMLAQVDAQPVKIRLLLVVATLLLLVTGSLWFIGHVADEYQQQLWKLRLLPEQANQQRQQLAEQLAAGENSQVQSLKQQIDLSGKKLDGLKYTRLDYVRGLSGSGQLQRVVDQLLRNNRGLTLIRLETLPVQALLSKTALTQTEGQLQTAQDRSGVEQPPVATNSGQEATEVEPAQADIAEGLYRHGLQLSVRGKWFDLTGYLEQLEDTGLRIFWHALDLQAGPYPYSTMTLNLFTVSEEAT